LITFLEYFFSIHAHHSIEFGFKDFTNADINYNNTYLKEKITNGCISILGKDAIKYHNYFVCSEPPYPVLFLIFVAGHLYDGPKHCSD
jgi:hypothetical protein